MTYFDISLSVINNTGRSIKRIGTSFQPLKNPMGTNIQVSHRNVQKTLIGIISPIVFTLTTQKK
jgi:hypothetical protein